MLDELVSIERLAKVLEHSLAPMFLLGSVAGLLTVLLARTEHLLGRMRQLKASGSDHQAYPEHDLARLKMRVQLLHRAAFYSLCSAVVTSILVIVAFISGFLNLRHEYGSAGLFAVSIGLLVFSLGLFAKEIRTALRDYDQFG
jgi:hypothetical protein